MRLPRESPRSSRGGKCGYQMQQVIENASTSPLPATVDRPGPVGLRGYFRWQRLPERRSLRTLSLGQMEQPAPVSQGVVVRRQRPGPALPDRTGRKSLLRPIAPVGPGMVASRPAGPGR